METRFAVWERELGTPEHYDFEPSCTLIETCDHPEFDGELYRQANGPGTFQRVIKVFPKNSLRPVPAVAVPFYFPEGMLGFEPSSGAALPRYKGIEMMLHLVRRGYAAASADAFHLTYAPSTRERGDFTRWSEAAAALLHDQPHWTGMGKLVADTRLLVDTLAGDARIDANRIGIAGHSLGGKMAFYTGCLDSRIKVILASDFGIRWDQTNWRDPWYWGEKVDAFESMQLDHGDLLAQAAPKPFFLIAGHYDDERSFELMRRARGYEGYPERLSGINHATGHRPPMAALDAGYDFLDRWL